MHYFLCTGGPGAVSIKKCTETHYVELVFLHPVGSAGHVVYSGGSVVQTVNVLFFMLEWDWYRFDKKGIETRYTEVVLLHSGISEARNVETLFFMFSWDRYRYDKKCVGTRYTKLVFLHPVGSAGHVVHSGASGPRDVTLFFMLGWDLYTFNKKHVGTRYAGHMFLHLMGSAGHIVHSGASGA
jgi:hypothetical protein